MDERRLQQLLAGVEPRAGARERAEQALADGLARRRGSLRRRAAGVLAGLAAALAAATLTAPGQAAVDWALTFVRVQSSSDDRGFNAGEQFGQGTLSDGSIYILQVGEQDGQACPGVSLGPEAAANGRGSGAATCTFRTIRKRGLGLFLFLPLANGGMLAYGLASPEVARVEANSAEPLPEPDLIPLRGEIVEAGGTSKPIPPSSLVVAELPTGVGDADGGVAAEITAYDKDGAELDHRSLGWIGMRGSSSLPLSCEHPVAKDLCGSAASGELHRADRKLARKLPPQLEEALFERGFRYTPATDSDRAVPPREGLDLAKLVTHRLSGEQGLAYERLGRLSGNGYEGHLVFLFHYFSVSKPYREGGGWTDADSLEREVDPLKGRAWTWIFDAETGELLKRIDYRGGQ